MESPVRQICLSVSAVFLHLGEKETEKNRNVNKTLIQFVISMIRISTVTHWDSHLIRSHRHTSHNHWVHPHLPPHLTHVASSAGWHAPVHHHAPILAGVPLLPKLLLPRVSLLPKLLLRVRTGEARQTGRKTRGGLHLEACPKHSKRKSISPKCLICLGHKPVASHAPL